MFIEIDYEILLVVLICDILMVFEVDLFKVIKCWVEGECNCKIFLLMLENKWSVLFSVLNFICFFVMILKEFLEDVV